MQTQWRAIAGTVVLTALSLLALLPAAASAAPTTTQPPLEGPIQRGPAAYADR